MTYRLLHTADLHLDRAFAMHGCHGELARRRRLGLRDALTRLGALAADNRCDAITIAGDLYEHERAGVDTEGFLTATFASWQPLNVFIAPGNHDALMPGSLYRRTQWPANVHIFSEPFLSAVELDDGLRLWGLAHREPGWMGNPLDVAAPSGDGVDIALFHGAELGSRPDGKSIHGPFRAEEIRAHGFAFALCGHYHRRRIDDAHGLLYPGTPEPLTFDDVGRRGPVLVDVAADGAVQCTPLDTSRWTAVTVPCDVSASTSTSDVIDHAVRAVARACDEAERTLVRLEIEGTVDCRVSLDRATLEAEVRERAGTALVHVRDVTQPAIDIEAAAVERSAQGAFVRAVLAAQESAHDDDAAVLNDVLRYGLEALAGAEVGLR
ncbi:MAG: exonuclease SbcCD subunit D [Candidatus Dormibacteria bacterium]